MPTSTKLLELLRDLEEPSPSVHIRTVHDGRTIAAAEKRGLIMEYTPEGGGPMFLRTDAGSAFLVLEEVA